MEILKKNILLLLILAIATPIFAKKYDRDAVYKIISKTYTLNEDGSTDYRERKELKIFTTMTFDAFGETFIPYNPYFQILTINEACVVREDGTKVETPANAFNPMLPEYCTKCERLNTIREMVVTHTGLEHNATIVLDYTIHSKNFFFANLLESIYLSESVPVEKYEITVSAPSSMNVNFCLNFDNLTYRKIQTTDNKSITTKWIFNDITPASSDEYLPKSSTPTLSFTTLRGYEDLVILLAQQQSLNKFSNGKITDFFNDYLKDTQGDKERILAVRDYIATYIVTRRVNPKLLNYVLASPEHVWNSNCAIRAEKDILLSGVLQSLGYNATLSFVYSKLAEELETCVCVVVESDTVLVSANEPEELSLEAFLAPATLITQNGNILKLLQKPIKIDVETVVNFEDNNLETPVIQYIRKDVSSPKNSRIIAGEINPVYVLSKKSDEYYILTVGESGYGTMLRSEEIFSKRKHAISVPQCDENYVYHINLPESARCLTNSFSETASVAGVKLHLETKVDGRQVTVTRRLTLPNHQIPAKEAEKVKALLGKWESAHNILYFCRLSERK